MKSTITKMAKLEESVKFLTQVTVQKDREIEPQLEVLSELPLTNEEDCRMFNGKINDGKEFATCVGKTFNMFSSR